MLRVLVNGADGRMGSQVVKAVFEDPELTVAGGVSITHVGEDVGEVAGVGHLGLAIEGDFAKALEDIKPDVVVDFTTPAVILKCQTCNSARRQHGRRHDGSYGRTAPRTSRPCFRKEDQYLHCAELFHRCRLDDEVVDGIAPYLPDAKSSNSTTIINSTLRRGRPS